MIDGVGTMKNRARRLTAALLVGTMLGGIAVVQPGEALAQQVAPAAAPVTSGIVREIIVRGSERLEPETVRSYIDLRVGDTYDRERLDQALKAMFATELFADARIRDEAGTLVVEVRENPVINRIVLEGNKRLKEEKIREEIRLAPRQIFTRSKARADVARILELYRRQGRFAASVEPKIVQLDQNRVDVVFEMVEGAKSKVRQINIIGNKAFSDGDLRDEMATKASRWYKIFTSNDTYDPDRQAYDQQKLRQFYLSKGYADFRVVSAVAELTPQKDFIVTFVVDEGERYKFAEVDLESQIRDIKPEAFKSIIRLKKGDWYDAKAVEDTVTSLTDTVGLLGYAFADIRPNFDRNKEKRTMSVTFLINEAPRVYVERIDVNGNTRTKDKIIRREFRLAEGDAFNTIKVKRSRDRIQSLGFFQEKLEVEQKPGSTPDKIVLGVNIEEKSTGTLQISAGFSSLEKFILNLSVEQRNFRGMAQQLRTSINYSSYSKSVNLGFTEPYLFNRNLALGADIFRQDSKSFGFGVGNDRQTIYNQLTTGFQLRTGFPITEYWAASTRYGLSREKVKLSDQFFNDLNIPADGIQQSERISTNCNAGFFVCEAIGNFTISSIGYSVVFDNLNNRARPSRGNRFVFNQDLAGVGGDVKYLRTRANFDKYWGLPAGFILNAGAEAGYIRGLGGKNIRLTDRFFLGEPELRGFDIRGVGPRTIQRGVDATTGAILGDRTNALDTALGGDAYYRGRLEVEIPLGSGGRELGIRPSVFADVGALWDTKKTNNQFTCRVSGTVAPVPVPGASCSTVANSTIFEEFVGDSPKPRLSVGAGISWNSPFGPFRIDFAKALTKVDGDDTKSFQFNVGTQF